MSSLKQQPVLFALCALAFAFFAAFPRWLLPSIAPAFVLWWLYATWVRVGSLEAAGSEASGGRVLRAAMGASCALGRTFETDERGMTLRRHGNVVASVPWSELRKVSVVTGDGGPFEEDCILVLHTADDQELVVPHSIVEDSFLERLQQLPGFNNEAFCNAMASVENAEFVCWASPLDAASA